MRANEQSFEHELSLAVKAAHEAGAFLLKCKQQPIIVNSSINKDIKLEADVLSEKMITDILLAGSTHNILSEESGYITKDNDSGYFWIVDPLDGSLNFSRQIDICGVSIGLWKDNEPVLGVIYDFIHDQMYTGIVGQYAACNGIPINVSSISEKKVSILATGFPVYSDQDKESLNLFIDDVQQYKKVRLLGSAALSLVHVAKGSIEAYKEKNIAIWDVAAGLAILIAAGGKAEYPMGKGKHYLNVYATNGIV
ncbi:inositol monophosphatase [Mucilaginibacter mali]|uniref:Inositol monophosphatase n=1 Tax=Mucilaginibacter mali TaxID=2740462 RepID=A0A7D4TQM4_9SPHI|nr:inositol monophosphatase family protein [Mucilaginibacter mali]QKJ31474.1 inositol monophosphatase [Mucilaginibacter mali]